MKILVTGGTGYIGSHTVVELQQKGFDVVIVDALFNSRIQALDAIESVTGIRPEFESFDLAEHVGAVGVPRMDSDAVGLAR